MQNFGRFCKNWFQNHDYSMEEKNLFLKMLILGGFHFQHFIPWKILRVNGPIESKGGPFFVFIPWKIFQKSAFTQFSCTPNKHKKNDPLKSALSKQHSQTRTNIAHIFQMEHWVAAKKVRLAIKAAADALEMFDRRVTHEELVAICVRTTPSLLGKFLFVQCGRMVCLFLLLYVHSHGYSSEFGILV